MADSKPDSTVPEPAQDQIAKTRFKSEIFSDLIDVLVADAEPMRVYTSKLRKIPFFNKCLQEGFRERQERIVRMPEDDPEEVEYLLKYAVLGKEAAMEELKPDVISQLVTDEFCPELKLMKLYVLAHKMGYEEYQNALTDAMRDCISRFFPDTQCFSVLEQAGLEKCKMFALLTTIFAHNLDGRGWERMTSIRGYNEWVMSGGRSVRQVMKKLTLGAFWDPGNALRPICRWHVHVVTPKCRDDQVGEDSEDDLTDLEDSK